jgi:DNA (cytosine-5)-methyltransferase 1
LLPSECAKLQGFAPDYLDITFRNKPAADGNKYKALGNSWAVPCGAWVLRRLVEAMPEARRDAA